TSAKLLAKHLLEDHNILTKFRCAECKKSSFKSFRSVTAHQQHCANPLPDPVPKEPRFTPSESRPPLGTGTLSDILAVNDEPFRVIAAKVLCRTDTIDQLYYEFVRIVAKPKRRSRPKVADNIDQAQVRDRKSTRLNSSHVSISYAVFCLKKKKRTKHSQHDR